MTATLLAVFLASLAGSLHCVGMCGPLVAFWAGGDESAGRKRIGGHAAYHGGRLAAYLVLGAAAGSLGRILDLAGAAAGHQRIAAILVGALMIAWGLVSLVRIFNARWGARWPGFRTPAFFTRAAAKLYRSVKDRPPTIRALVVGLFSGVLPCGWLYAFVLVASGTGSAALGALVMIAFWAGNLPWLAGLGLGVQTIGAPLRRHVPALTAVLLVVMGIAAVVNRAAVPFDRASAHAAAKASALPGGPAPAETPAAHDADAPCH